MPLAKKCHFLRYLDLIKIRLEIMLSDFSEKKKPFFTIKNTIFQSPKPRIFPKGLTHAFHQKMPISSLFRFGQNTTSNNALRFCREKETFFVYKKQNFQKSKNSHFSKGVNPCFSS